MLLTSSPDPDISPIAFEPGCPGDPGGPGGPGGPRIDSPGGPCQNLRYYYTFIIKKLNSHIHCKILIIYKYEDEFRNQVVFILQ